MNSMTHFIQQERLSRCFITTPQIDHTLTRIDDVICDTKYSGKAKGLLIRGPSGAGKSTMIKKLMNDRRSSSADDREFKTIYMELPSKPTTKSMGESLLEVLGDACAKKHGHSAEFKLLRIIGLLRDLGTELLILDEAQHIVDHQRNTLEASNWIKKLMNHTGLAVILVGMRNTQTLLDNDEQLRRRFSATVDFDRFKIIKAPSTDFFRLLQTLERSIAVKSISFTTHDIAQRFYYASYGLIDYLVKVVDRATNLVQKRKLEGITLETLSEAFKDEVWSTVKDNRNPFSSYFTFRSLVERGEPFHDVECNQQ
jgi:GTPase SAR1 family protein